LLLLMLVVVVKGNQQCLIKFVRDMFVICCKPMHY
jgi:hypothetical protein